MRKKYAMFKNGCLIGSEFEDTMLNGKLYTVDEQVKDARDKGIMWKPMDDIDCSKLVTDEYSVIKTIPFENGDRISYNYVKDINVREIKFQINTLKEELASSDYKIIKAYEASLTKSPMPYNLNNLHEERQSLRDRINYLEKMI